MTDSELVKTISRWQRQVWEQLYLARAAAARQELDNAWREWHKTLGSPDVRRALEIYLHLLEYDCASACVETSAAKHPLVLRALSLVEPAARSRLAASCRARVLLILRCNAHVLGARELTAAEVKTLLGMIQLETMGHQTCMHLAHWAFAVRNSEYLQLAYRLFLVNHYDFMLDFSRQRVRVMLLLVEQECEAAEVAALITALPHPLHAQWFAAVLQPELLNQGIWTDALAAAFLQKQALLSQAEASLPPRATDRDILPFQV